MSLQLHGNTATRSSYVFGVCNYRCDGDWSYTLINGVVETPSVYFQPKHEKLTSSLLFRFVGAVGTAEVVSCSWLSGAWRYIIPEETKNDCTWLRV